MSPATAPRYKVFISYADADESWARGRLLPELGLATDRLITFKEFTLGAPIVSEFERAVRESEYTLLVLSEAYQASQWNVFTEQIAAYDSVESGRKRVIPVVLSRENIPLSIRNLYSVDCTNPANWASELSRLREFLKLPAPETARVSCPYPGMKPYGADCAATFFGRDTEAKKLAGRLELQQFLVLVGASGCGKSSLVFAGVTPRLEQAGGWLIRTMRPGAAPMQDLAAKLETTAAPDTDWAGAADALLEHEKRDRFLLVIDQLEEAFSLPRDSQDPFLLAVRSLKRSPRCVALMTMRADFFESLLNSKLAPVDQTEQMNLSPLRGEQLRQAIVGPAEKVKVYLEPVLLQRLITDAGDEPGILPMLQETMTLLWEKRDRCLLTEQAYRDLDPDAPGIAVALSLRGQAALAGLSESQRNVARRITLRLINFGDGRADTRRQQRVTDLRSAGDDPADFQTALNQLAQNRILTLDGGQSSMARVDLAHECLILGWPSLRGWIQQYKDAETNRRGLVIKSKEWERLRRRAGWLDEVELDEAEKWIRGPDAAVLGVDPLLKEFTTASRRRCDRGRWFLRGAITAVVIALLVAARISAPRWLADQALELTQRPDRFSHKAALSKALWAVRLGDSTYTRDALHQAVQTVEQTGRFPALDTIGIAFGPEGEKLAGISKDAVLIVPNSTAQGFFPAGQPDAGAYFSVVFRPEKSGLAVGTRTGKLLVWNDPATGAPEINDGHSQTVTCVAYSGKGNLLATGSEDNTILVRNADTRKVALGPLKAKGRINRIAFSPDGKYLAAATSESTEGGGDPAFVAKVWAIDKGAWVRDFGGHKGVVTDVAFSPNGKRMATAAQDGRLRVWDWQDQKAAGPVSELSHDHDKTFGGDEPFWMAQNAFAAVAFDGNDRLASITNNQNFAEIWDIATGKPIDSLRGHRGGIRALAYSSAGGKRKLATAGDDQTVRIYYLDTADLIARAEALR